MMGFDLRTLREIELFVNSNITADSTRRLKHPCHPLGWQNTAAKHQD